MTQSHIPEDIQEKMREADQRGLRGCLIFIAGSIIITAIIVWLVFK